MSFRKCYNCGYSYLKNAPACPRCGAPNQGSDSSGILTILIYVGVGCVAAAIVFLVMTYTNRQTAAPAPSPQPAQTEQTQSTNVQTETTTAAQAQAPATGQQVSTPNAARSTAPATTAPVPSTSSYNGIYSRSYTGTVGNLGIKMQLTFNDNARTASGYYRFNSGGANVNFSGSWNPRTGSLELNHYRNGSYRGHLSGTASGNTINGTVYDYVNNQVFTLRLR